MAKPEQISSDTGDSDFTRSPSYSKNHEIEIIHTYTLYNKGPSDATRTEVKLMWPMLPSHGFNEQSPLLHSVDLPSVIRVSDPKVTDDRCYIYQPVRRDLSALD